MCGVQVPFVLKIMTQFRVLFATFGGGGHCFLAYKLKPFSRIPQFVKNHPKLLSYLSFYLSCKMGRKRGRVVEILEIIYKGNARMIWRWENFPKDHRHKI